MKQINLKSSDTFVQRSESSKGTTSILIGVLILFISAGLYAWLSYENGQIQSRIDAAQSEITQKTNFLKEKQFSELYDFQGRLLDMEDKMANYIKQSANLESISRATLPRTEFKILTETGEGKVSKYEAVVEIPDQAYLSQQMEAFRGIKDINGLSLLNTKQEESGIIGTVLFEIGKSPLKPTNN